MRRVAFSVEPIRVEQSTDFDRLVLDIETDGSLTPREALASAGDTLRSLVGLVADLEDEPQGLELGEVGTSTSGSPDLDLAIEDLDLSERPRNCLKRAQVNTIGELVERTPEDLLAITNFGQKSLDEVIQRLDERGLSLRSRTEARPCAARPEGAGDSAATPRTRRRCSGNLVASLIAAESLVTTEAKAKALRPVAEKCITAAVKGGVHRQRNVVALIRDKDMAYKLFAEIGPALLGPTRWLHPHPEARPAPGRQRAHGAHRTGLTLFDPDLTAAPGAAAEVGSTQEPVATAQPVSTARP